MKLLGNAYLSTKKRMRPFVPSRKPQSQQLEMAEQFLAQWKSGAGLEANQLLAGMLLYTSQSVPFYRQYFAKNPQKDPAELTDWPVLTRDHLCNETASLQSMAGKKWKTWTHASGGSTGKPVIVVHDEHFAAKAAALRSLCAELFFKGPHYNKLILWGMVDEVDDAEEAPSFRSRIKNRVRTQMGLKTSHINTFAFTQQKFAACVRILQRQKPDFIFGYAGSIYELAKYLEENSIKVPHAPKMIGTTAQTLHPFMRERIERVFGTKICDHYGSREVGPAAWQHPNGAMCFPKFFSKVEVVDADGQPVAVGEQGRILVTTLHNYSMPLIRYDIGDLGVMGEDMSVEGYPCATLTEISGRTSEEFTTVDGSKICAPFFINLFYYKPWLDQFYIVQKKRDLVEIMYIPTEAAGQVPDDERNAITQKIQTVMSKQCQVDWIKVSEIPTTKSGKRLFIRSEV